MRAQDTEGGTRERERESKDLYEYGEIDPHAPNQLVRTCCFTPSQ